MPSIGEYFPGIKEGLVTFDGIDIADLGDILDANDNEILEFDTTASAVNNFRIANAAASSGPTLSAVGDDTNINLNINPKGTGSVVLGTSGATTTTALDIVGSGLTTGKGIDLSDLGAITTGKAIHVDATGVTQTDGILVHIDSASTALTSTGRLLLIDHTGASTISGIVSEIASAATDETTIFKVTASAALAAGTVLDLSATAVTTGTVLDLGGLDALTTGTAVNVVSNSSSTGTRSLVKIVNDNTAATGATGLTVQQDANLAAIAITGVTTTGIDFTALGDTDRIFNATAGTGSTAAPQTNAPTGFIKVAVAGTDQWIPYYNAT